MVRVLTLVCFLDMDFHQGMIAVAGLRVLNSSDEIVSLVSIIYIL